MPRFALTAPREYEQQLHEATAKLLAIMLKPPAAAQCVDVGQLELTKAQAAKLQRAGVRPGWPDFIVVYQGIYGIELKRPGGRLTERTRYRTAKGRWMERPGQDEVFPVLIDAGMPIRVCFSLPDVMTALRDWQIPIRESERPPAVTEGRLSDQLTTTTNQGK